MQRYHDTTTDPLPIHSPQHDVERANIASQTAEFLASGGKVQQIGFCMSDRPTTFSINPERSPVYAHLFAPVATEAPPVTLAFSEHDQADEQKLVALIMADAALGNSPKWIAKKHHMTEKRVRQIARTYHITFHKQR